MNEDESRIFAFVFFAYFLGSIMQYWIGARWLVFYYGSVSVIFLNIYLNKLRFRKNDIYKEKCNGTRAS